MLFMRRKTMTNYVSILKQADIFFQFKPDQLGLVANICQECSYNTGDIIFLEGDHSDELYVIVQGDVEIVVNPGLVSPVISEKEKIGPVTLTTLRRGQSFGEIALVDRGFRSATARAAQNNTRLLIIPETKLTLLCETYPEMGYQLMRNLAADLAFKIRSTDLRIREELLYSRRKGREKAN
jgi:CRP-like cAMP-binding protein